MAKKEKKEKKDSKKKDKKEKDKKDSKKKDKKEKKDKKADKKDKKEKAPKTAPESTPAPAPTQSQPNPTPNPPTPQDSLSKFTSFPPANFPTMLPPTHPHSLLHHTITSQLIPKRHALLTHLSSLQSKLYEVSSQKEQILEETRQYYTAICERVEVRARSKMDRVRDEVVRIEENIRDLDRFVERSVKVMETSGPLSGLGTGSIMTGIGGIGGIGAIGAGSSMNTAATQTITDSTQIPPPQTPQQQDYIAECKYLASKPVERPLHLGEAFPREMQESNRIRQCYEELKRIVDVKDQIIADLLHQRDQCEQRRRTEVHELTRLYQNTKNELFNWIQLSDQYMDKNAQQALQRKVGYSVGSAGVGAGVGKASSTPVRGQMMFEDVSTPVRGSYSRRPNEQIDIHSGEFWNL